MKQFGRLLFSVLIVILAASAAVTIGCSKDKCGGTTCQNGGACTDSKCVCPTGYSGTSCDKGWSDKAIGLYNCSRSSCNPAVSGVNAWKSYVTKNSKNGGYVINISNFDNSNTTIGATIDSLGLIKISPTSGAYGVNASGSISGNTIHLLFTTSIAGGGGYECQMEMVRE